MSTIIALACALVLLAPPDASRLAQQLKSKDRQKRRDAARELAYGKADPRPALPALIQALQDRDPQVSANAMRAIARIGPDAKEAVPGLAKHLHAWPPREHYLAALALASIGKEALPVIKKAFKAGFFKTRAAAAFALENMAPGGAELLEPLADLLGDQDESVRRAASRALAAFHRKAVPYVLAKLEAPNHATQRAALETLARLGKDAAGSATSAAIEKALGHADPEVQAAALAALASIDGLDKHLPRFIAALAAPSKPVRIAAHNAFGDAPWSKEKSHAIAQLLAHNDADVRRRAVELLGVHRASEPVIVRQLLDAAQKDLSLEPFIERALAAMGPPVAPTLVRELPQAGRATGMVARVLRSLGVSPRRAVFEALAASDAAVRASAIRSLASLEVTPQTIRELTRALDDRQPPVVRLAAAEACAVLLDQHRELVAPLLSCLSDQDHGIQEAALAALPYVKTPSDEIVAAVADILESDRVSSKEKCLKAMRAWNAIPDALVPVYRSRLDDSSPQVRRAAVALLPKWKSASSATLAQQLRDRINDPDAAVRAAACEIAGVLGQVQAHRRVEWLRKALRDGAPEVRAAACASLGRMGREAKAAVPDLLERLQKPGDAWAAREALRAIGAAGPEAVPALRRMLSSPQWELRRYAVFLLGRVEPPPVDVLPELEKLKGQGPEPFRRLVRSTIRRIRKAR